MSSHDIGSGLRPIARRNAGDPHRPTEARPLAALTIHFVVLPDRAQLSELVQRVRLSAADKHRNVAALDIGCLQPTERIKGKTIIPFIRETRGLPNAHEVQFTRLRRVRCRTRFQI